METVKVWHALMLGRTVRLFCLGRIKDTGDYVYRAELYKGHAYKGTPFVEVVFTPKGKAPRFIFAELIREIQSRRSKAGDPVKQVFPRPSYLTTYLGWSSYSDKGERGSKGYREAFIGRIVTKRCTKR